MHPSNYINNNIGSTSFCYYNHEDPNYKPANMHSTMENCSYNNGKLAASDGGVDRINSHVNLESKCLTNKRSCKKDRHSKINTARGPRDRRMRLSLEVAKKFFSLQDMLGFDKASSTIEWLMMKSKGAIRDLGSRQLNHSCRLMGVSNSPSYASECEVLSGIDDIIGDNVIVMDKDNLDCGSGNKEKKKKTQRLRKTVYVDHSLAKETRDKARARARNRTSEKRNIIKLAGYDRAGCHQYSKLRPILDQVIDQNSNRLGSWIPFGENQIQLTDQAEYPSSHFQFKQGIIGDNSSMLSSNWNPSFLFNYQHNPVVSHEHQLGDLQLLGKPWEGISS